MKYNTHNPPHSITVLKNGKPVETVSRTIRFEQVGNFNPAFCTYKGEKYLVQSFEGDLSDPFRRTEAYLTTLYIETSNENPF
jgi:hypothetical protein